MMMLEKKEDNRRNLKRKKVLKKLKTKGERRNMLKKMIKYIFIYTISVIFIGCESNVLGPNGECTNCHLEIEAPNLPMDKNGVYQLDYNDGEIQTFTQLKAYIGYEMEYGEWVTNVTFEGCTWDYCEDVPVVNGSGYSSDDGYSYQIMGVMEENIGQTATIWVGYYDNYGTQWIDNIEVKINE
jgi:hypothetical protein